MPWISRKLRGTNVYVRTGPDGAPAAAEDGRVDILYKLVPDAKVYRAALKNLEPTGDPKDEVPREYPEVEGPRPESAAATGPGPSAAAKRTPEASVDSPDVIHIYTDGACTGNPGPAGLGAVILDRGERHELSEYLGEATNNIAELSAILRALQSVEDRTREIWLHSDSTYSIGLLTKNWKPKANQALVAELRALVAQFPRLRFIKVPAHSGVPENERADELARAAITSFQTTG